MEYLLLTILIIALLSIYINFKIGISTSFNKVVLFFLCFASFHVCYTFAYEFFNFPKYIDAGFPFGLVYGPVFYFALKTASESSFSLRNALLHLIPFVLWIILFLIFALSPSFRLSYYGVYYSILYSLTSISMISYVVMAFIFNWKRIQSESFVKTVRLITIGIAVLTTIGLLILTTTLTHIIPRTTDSRQFPRYLIYTALLIQVCAVLRYQIGRLRQNDIDPVQDNNFSFSESDNLAQYQKSLISDSTMDIYELKLKELIKNKVFQDAGLSLESLGKQIGAPKHHLTQLLNLRMKKSFKQFINEHRVHHACSILKDSSQEFSFEKLAFDCGFNSKASFNRNFKSITGFSPSEYRKRLC